MDTESPSATSPSAPAAPPSQGQRATAATTAATPATTTAVESAAASPSPTAIWPALKHGWARRCPRCGGEPLFARFFTLRQGCGRCRLTFEVDPGDTWALWLIGDRVFIGLLIIAVFLVFRSDSWTFGMVLVVVTVVPLIWTMPHRMGVCIAVDYLVRARWGDLATVDAAEGTAAEVTADEVAADVTIVDGACSDDPS